MNLNTICLDIFNLIASQLSDIDIQNLSSVDSKLNSIVVFHFFEKTTNYECLFKLSDKSSYLFFNNYCISATIKIQKSIDIKFKQNKKDLSDLVKTSESKIIDVKTSNTELRRLLNEEAKFNKNIHNLNILLRKKISKNNEQDISEESKSIQQIQHERRSNILKQENVRNKIEKLKIEIQDITIKTIKLIDLLNKLLKTLKNINNFIKSKQSQ